MDSGGGAGENIDSKSRAGPSSSTLTPKSGQHLAYCKQHQRDSVLKKPTLVINAVCVFKHSRKTSGRKLEWTGSSALAHVGCMKSVFWTVL